MLRRLLTFAAALMVALSALVSAGCGGGEAKSAARPAQPAKAVCPATWKAGWQELASRIQAPVYCPSWVPDPLTGEIGGPWEAMHSVLGDRSYLIGFLWYEANLAEMHVNFRAYPGKTSIPTCNGRPCFNDPGAKKQIAGLDVQVYNVNRGADTWHILYAWKADGSLYTVSQHVVPALGLPYGQVASTLDRVVRGLVRIEPQQS